ncbi:hypothetical protein ALC56_12034, partial [Trachymyrmex septentrionalis]
QVQEYSSSLFQEIHGSESRNNEIQLPQLRKDAKLRARKDCDARSNTHNHVENSFEHLVSLVKDLLIEDTHYSHDPNDITHREQKLIV